MSFRKTPDFKGINEERVWTNPHIRFIRKNGRVIPIVNKKRIGQDVEYLGRKSLKASAAFGGLFAAKKVAKRSKLGQAARKDFAKLFSSIKKSKVAKKMPKFSIKSKLGRVTTYTATKSFNAAKAVFKHPGKIGLILGAIGGVGYTFGSDLQMRSELGKDFFFIKDQFGRDS